MLGALAAPASATLPPGNTVQQWNKIAEDTVVGSGAFQTEGLLYMSYASAAVYDAHGTLTSAMAEVFTAVFGTNRIDLDIHGFDPAGPAGNLNAVRHFDTTSKLRREIINPRLWAGLHYRPSTVAGIVLGRQVANFDLTHAFQPLE
jgi:hypothetical protein